MSAERGMDGRVLRREMGTGEVHGSCLIERGEW